MPPWYVVMIIAAVILLIWFWWMSPRRNANDTKPSAGEGVLDEAVTAFDDVARQIIGSDSRNRLDQKRSAPLSRDDTTRGE